MNTEFVQTKISKEVKVALIKKAASKGHKLASYVRFLIEQDVKKK